MQMHMYWRTTLPIAEEILDEDATETDYSDILNLISQLVNFENENLSWDTIVLNKVDSTFAPDDYQDTNDQE